MFPTDRLVVCFRSGVVSASRHTTTASLWGIKFTASAPVNPLSLQRLMDTWAGAEHAAHAPNLTLCKRLLALYNNNYAEAGVCVCAWSCLFAGMCPVLTGVRCFPRLQSNK